MTFINYLRSVADSFGLAAKTPKPVGAESPTMESQLDDFKNVLEQGVALAVAPCRECWPR